MNDEERTSDTTETYGSQDAPGGVSNQNTEEGSAPGSGSGGGAGPAKRDQEDQGAGRDDSSNNPGREGGASEGSQATGSEDSAG